MKQAQPMGQRMDQARARFRRGGREGSVGAAEGPGEFRTSAAGGDASPDRPGGAQAGSPAASDASCTSQREPRQIFGSFDRTYRNMWNPEAGRPPDQLIHAGLTQEGGAALEAETGAEQDPKLRDQDDDEAEGLRRGACSRRAAGGGEPAGLRTDELNLKLTESCVIEQHIDRLLKSVEPTNLELGTPDAAALTVRIVRGWANNMAGSPSRGRTKMSCYQWIWRTPTAGRFGRHASKWRGAHSRSLLRSALHHGSLATRGSVSDAMMAGLWTAR